VTKPAQQQEKEDEEEEHQQVPGSRGPFQSPQLMTELRQRLSQRATLFREEVGGHDNRADIPTTLTHIYNENDYHTAPSTR